MFTTALDKKAVLAAFILGLLTILGAWGSQVFGGLVPCELCLEQRLPYYIGLPVLAALFLVWNRIPLWAWYLAMAVAVVIFAWSIYLSGYHAGVEYGFWPGPTACTGTGVEMNFEDLNNIDAARVVPCDKVQFRFLGITLAGYNFLISIGIVKLLLIAIADQVIRGRRAQASSSISQ